MSARATIPAPRLAIGLAVLVGGSAAAGVLVCRCFDLPAGALDPRDIAATQILDRHGALVREVLSRDDGRANWVPLTRIAPFLVQATLAGEDRRFFTHRGVDGLAVLRALALNIGRRRVVSGASTLTMQLVRLLDGQRPASRHDSCRGLPAALGAKLRQAVLAYRLEHQLSKREILWQYLNRAPYGNGTFGAEAAARRYFDKPAARLSLAEAALLAGLPRAPSAYNPFRAGRTPLRARQRYILGLMRLQGRISSEQHRLALGEAIDFSAAERPFEAPHLVQQLLARPELRGSSALRTTIDPRLQRAAQTAAREAVARLADHRVTSAAVLVIDNASAEVLAYVGSADFDDDNSGGQVDGTRALRQPGSTLKPFTYALALEQGKTAASLLQDLPAHFATARGDYAPRNYDGEHHGPVRLRVALGSSYNIPAVRVAEQVGVGPLLARLRRTGFASLTRGARHYGLGLTLGNGEVTLQELGAAYAALARGGVYRPLRFVQRARDARGRWTGPPEDSARRIFDRRVAYLVSDILADPAARRPAFGRDSVLDVGFPAAVKTGTSKDYRDNWTVGYTPEVTVAVWVGNFDRTPMRRISGIAGAGPLWAEVMTAAMRGRRDGTPPHFTRPASLVTAAICPLSGALPGPHCPAAVEEHFLADTAPRGRCAFHQQVLVDAESGLRAPEGCRVPGLERRAVVALPPVYRAWAARRGLPQPPVRFSPRCPPPADPARARTHAVRVRFPVHGDTFFIDPDLRRPYQRVPLEASVDGPAEEVRWLVDGRVIARAGFPYAASWPLRRGEHTVQAQLSNGLRSRAVRISVQ